MVSKVAMIVFFAAVAINFLISNSVLIAVEAIAAGVAAIALAANA